MKFFKQEKNDELIKWFSNALHNIVNILCWKELQTLVKSYSAEIIHGIIVDSIKNYNRLCNDNHPVVINAKKINRYICNVKRGVKH